jgi:D-alanyl-D-alanine dipeptidase
MTECIDDVNSELYNQVVNKDKVEKVDWKSSEKMRSMGIYYELGVIVDNNRNPVEKGKGSCIFLHNWSNPNETMAGCTAMAADKMKEIVYRLDAGKKPVLVQLTKELYIILVDKWSLPVINKYGK